MITFVRCLLIALGLGLLYLLLQATSAQPLTTYWMRMFYDLWLGVSLFCLLLAAFLPSFWSPRSSNNPRKK